MSSTDAAHQKTGLMFKNKRHMVAAVLFLIYFIVLFYFLFFSEELGRTFSDRAYCYNLVPLKEIKRFLQYRDVLGKKAVFLNLAGNVIAFMPFGTFLPTFFARCRKFFFTVWYSFELSLTVELLQLIFKVGSFDVDDLLLNTIGGLFGFFVYVVIARLFSQKQHRQGGKENETT